MNTSILDLLIIGAGPAGISTAIEAHKAGLTYLLIDKGSVVDSIQKFQRDMFFFSTPELLEIGDVPFVVPTTRPTSLDCVNYYRRVVQQYHLSCKFYDRVTTVTKEQEVFTLTCESGNAYRSKAVVIANGYYDTPNLLNVPGENLEHVSHFYRDSLPFFKRKVLIVGGKNSAVEAALDLYRHGADVTVVHRGAQLSGTVKYWILPDFENRVAQKSIAMNFNTIVKEFHPGKTTLQTGDKIWELENDAVFILIGYLPDVSFLKSAGIEIDKDSLVPFHNPETLETNIPNLYVAGGMVGGKFNNKIFIENGKVHGKQIIAAMLKK